MSGEMVKLEQLPDWAAAAVKGYVGKDVNLLLPAIPVNAGLGFGHKPMVSLVRVSPNPDDGDCYYVGGKFEKREGERDVWVKRYALAKPALDKIGSAAGISFNTIRVDDRRDPNICEVECRAAMKNESGAWVVKTFRKEINMADVEAARRIERQTANAKAEKKKSPDVIEDELRAEMAQYRKHLAARCETGAILRAIRGQLGLKAQWLESELAKPFIILRVDFQPDASDPVVKRMLLEQGARSSEALFGMSRQSEQATGAPVHVEAARVTTEADDVSGDAEPQVTPQVKTGLEIALEGGDDALQEFVKRGVEVLELSPGDYMKLAEGCGFKVEAMARVLDKMAQEVGQRRGNDERRAG